MVGAVWGYRLDYCLFEGPKVPKTSVSNQPIQFIQPATTQTNQRDVNDRQAGLSTARGIVGQNVLRDVNKSAAQAAMAEAGGRHSGYAVAFAKPANKEQQRQQQRQRKENLMIVGRSRKSFSQNRQAGHTDVIKAAKPYISKAVLCGQCVD